MCNGTTRGHVPGATFCLALSARFELELRRHARSARGRHATITRNQLRKHLSLSASAPLPAICMLPGIMSLSLAMAPVRSPAPRFPVCRPAAPFAPMPATRGGMTTGINGRVECDSAEPVSAANCQADAHLRSKPWLDTTCCDAASGACPKSGYGDRAAAVSAAASAPGPIKAVPRSAHNEAGACQPKTSRMQLRPSQGPTSGRRLTSCCMRESRTHYASDSNRVEYPLPTVYFPLNPTHCCAAHSASPQSGGASRPLRPLLHFQHDCRGASALTSAPTSNIGI